MAKILAIVPARAGSKGVRNKNIRLLGGHPLLGWTIAASKRSKLIERVIISTDSQDYAELARQYGAEAPFLRPDSISGDRASDYEFIIHALDWYADIGDEPEYIVHLRPTTPFREPGLIDIAIDAFITSGTATALRSVHEMSESAYKTFEIATTGQLKRVGDDSTSLDIANNARQLFPKTYMANGYVDVLSTKFIRRSGLLHGDYVLPFVTPVVTEVDTEDDFASLEYQLMQSPEIIHNIFDRGC